MCVFVLVSLLVFLKFQMLSLNSLWLKPVSSLSLNYKPRNDLNFVICRNKRYPFSFYSSSSTRRLVCSVEKESQHFEVDPDKAREALKQLDQQLQSLSQKQVRAPKIKGIFLFLFIFQ